MSVSGVLTGDSQASYTYDASNNMLSSALQVWDTIAMNWINTTQHFYTYNSDNKIIIDVHQDWDSAMAMWGNSDSTYYYYRDLTSGIKDNIAVSFINYPNPFNQQTTFYFNADLKDASMELFDAQGKKVLDKLCSGKVISIQRNNLNAGIYFVRIIENGKSVANSRLVIAD